MIECIFTVDYEIYGNGEGGLRELVLDPGEKLKTVFDRAGVKMVVFVEALEFAKIETAGSDPDATNVSRQILDFYQDGYEIALHLHPQWCNARYEEGRWTLDYGDYNLCPLGAQRIGEIATEGIDYLRQTLREPGFTPVSFRAGNWLFQPTATAARVLSSLGLKVDSSVFKGGRQHKHGLDYRAALRNGDFWRFREDVAVSEPTGEMLEIPIYTRMVPFWRMATAKRLKLQRKSSVSAKKSRNWRHRLRDLARFRQPLKFDFCRMTLPEMTSILEQAMSEDAKTPNVIKPVVAIGHTKDLEETESIERFLVWLKDKGIRVGTLETVYPKCAKSGQPELRAANQ